MVKSANLFSVKFNTVSSLVLFQAPKELEWPDPEEEKGSGRERGLPEAAVVAEPLLPKGGGQNGGQVKPEGRQSHNTHIIESITILSNHTSHYVLLDEG